MCACRMQSCLANPVSDRFVRRSTEKGCENMEGIDSQRTSGQVGGLKMLENRHRAVFFVPLSSLPLGVSLAKPAI